jgi:hypothetical protein
MYSNDELLVLLCIKYSTRCFCGIKDLGKRAERQLRCLIMKQINDGHVLAVKSRIFKRM